MGHRAASGIGALVLCLGLLMQQTPALASAGPRVSGGGIVDGALGTTSQLGFNASSSGGQFLCVMAGRSGGFPFGPWASIQQMRVEGPVDAGSLSIAADGSATFGGKATIHVVGKTSSGELLTMTLTGISYTSWQTAGGAGVAMHRLGVELGGPTTYFGPASLRSGQITIHQ